MTARARTRVRTPTRGTALAVLLLGAGVGFVAAAQPWWRAVGDETAVSFTGSEATGGLSQALPAVTLAGVLLALALRPRGVRVLAVALAVTGVGMAVSAALVTAPDADAVRSRVRQVSLTDQFALHATPWPWVYVVAGTVVLAGAALLWWAAPRWTGRTARFDRAASGGSGTPPTDLNADPGRAWKDLDAGLDPTADTPPENDPEGDPDVRTDGGGVRMERPHDHGHERGP